jgi:rhodanese-related sulfurtransferase
LSLRTLAALIATGQPKAIDALALPCGTVGARFFEEEITAMGDEDLIRVSRDDVERALMDGTAQVINVLERPAVGRLRLIPGSRSVPLSELEARLGELDRTRPIITYCANIKCRASKQAARLLRDRGYDVRVYEGGIQEWMEAGRQTEVAA